MNKKHPVLYALLVLVVLGLGFFVIGPLIDNFLVSSQMPYLLIDQSMVEQARSDCNCKNVPAIPIEMVSDTTGLSGTIVKLPVEKVPESYIQYVHYPDNWDKWWNMFNPNNMFTVWLSRILFVVCTLGGIGVIIYGIWLFKNKKFRFQRRSE